MNFSKWGMTIAALYLAITIALTSFAVSCSSFGCSGIVLLLMLPWIVFVDESGYSLGISEQTLFWGIIILNTLILYFLFAALERWWKKR